MTNKEIIISFFKECYEKHNYDYLLKNCANDYIDHSPAAARSNLQAVQILQNTEKTFANMQIDIENIICEGNSVAVRVKYTGKHISEYMGVPAEGRIISFEALEEFRLEDYKVVESWGYWPDLSIRNLLILD